MPLIFDHETMTTGDASLDAEHQAMFRLANELLAAMREGAATPALLEMLDRLTEETRRHFAHEEHCMHVHECPAAANNRHAHVHFMQVLGEFRAHLETGRPNAELAARWPQALETWIEIHIAKVDTQLAPCIRKRREMTVGA